jgi:hypothetical protein
VTLFERRPLVVTSALFVLGGCTVKGEPYEEPSTSTCTPLAAGDVAIEYVARVETGEGLAVLRPPENPDYEDFRFFFGASQLLVEREVESVMRQKDGGSTSIRFDFHGETADVSFPINAPASLVTGGGTFSVERLPDETIDTFSFECLD